MCCLEPADGEDDGAQVELAPADQQRPLNVLLLMRTVHITVPAARTWRTHRGGLQPAPCPAPLGSRVHTRWPTATTLHMCVGAHQHTAHRFKDTEHRFNFAGAMPVAAQRALRGTRALARTMSTAKARCVGEI